jgi:hypothetical protein
LFIGGPGSAGCNRWESEGWSIPSWITCKGGGQLNMAKRWTKRFFPLQFHTNALPLLLPSLSLRRDTNDDDAVDMMLQAGLSSAQQVNTPSVRQSTTRVLSVTRDTAIASGPSRIGRLVRRPVRVHQSRRELSDPDLQTMVASSVSFKKQKKVQHPVNDFLNKVHCSAVCCCTHMRIKRLSPSCRFSLHGTSSSPLP